MRKRRSAFSATGRYSRRTFIEGSPAVATRKTKSMTGKQGGRKLATGAGRAKHNRAGESQKRSTSRRGSASRTGSSKQRKG